MRKYYRDCDNNKDPEEAWLTVIRMVAEQESNPENISKNSKNKLNSGLSYYAKGSDNKSKWKCFLIQWSSEEPLLFLSIGSHLPPEQISSSLLDSKKSASSTSMKILPRLSES